jgi:KaiC/GvpD/RAD55 family RecA-like ATPase
VTDGANGTSGRKAASEVPSAFDDSVAFLELGDQIADNVEVAARSRFVSDRPPSATDLGQLSSRQLTRIVALTRGNHMSNAHRDAVVRLVADPRSDALADHELVEEARLASVIDSTPRGTPMPALADRLQEQARRPRVRLGFPELDATAPVPVGGNVVIIGPEGSGKSAFGLQVACNHALLAGPVVFVSLELDGAEIAARRVSQVADVSWEEALRGQVDQSVVAAALALPRMSVLERAEPNLGEVVSELRALGAKYPGEPRMVVVDYLQILPSEGRDERERTKNAAESLRRLAKEEECVVVVISQTSRSARAQLRKGDLVGADAAVAGAESSQIERAGYVVLVLSPMFQMDSGEVAVDVSIAKNRLGRGDLVVPMAFDGRRGRFLETGQAVPAGKHKAERSTRNDAKRAATAEHAIADLVTSAPEPMSRAAIRRQLNLKSEDVSRAVTNLLASRRLVEVRVKRSGPAWPVWTAEAAAVRGLSVVDPGRQ